MNAEILKRSILQLAQEAFPAPLTAAELVPLVHGGSDQPEQVAEAAKSLLAMGYLSNVNAGGGREAWYVITPTGVAQITRTAKELDRAIWGRLAV